MSDTTLRDAIRQVIDDNEVILFMKGTPEQPMCGFSARTAATLKSLDTQFAAVDILPDPRIRQELTALSSWPTIPQLFVRGELVGGADIVAEMHETGELARVVSGDEDAGAGPGEEALVVQQHGAAQPVPAAPPASGPLSIENRLS